MSPYDRTKLQLKASPKTWLITGVAGFIGSNLLEALLKLNQRVVGLDNFATGHRHNLAEVKKLVSAQQWKRFNLIEGDVRDPATCLRACRGIDYVLHQAALGSVPRSIGNPIDSNANNVTGFLNMLVAARNRKVRRFVYASSSSVYGDHPALPKVEEQTGRPLSPYAATKCVNELYAGVFAQCYGLSTIGLRYFNVFGPRQDPEGPYAAVIPKWIAAMVLKEPVYINGDGETSRDFCYIANVVEANLLSATARNPKAANQVYNVAVGERTTLNQLYQALWKGLLPRHAHLKDQAPVYREFRNGDVRHSQADIRKAHKLLGYNPGYMLQDGLAEALNWYVANLSQSELPKVPGAPTARNGNHKKSESLVGKCSSRREEAQSAPGMDRSTF